MSDDGSAQIAKLGTPVASGPRTWVQTERAAHEAWGKLTMKSQRAAALMHHFVANMGHQNAVVVSQKTLAKIMRCSTDTIQRAIRELEKDRWVEVVRLNGPGTVAAYVVNAAVAWGEKREHIGRLAVFHAAVVADAEDQPEGALERKELRRLPMIVPPEEALPAGTGEPGAQIALPGMEPVIEGKASAEPASESFQRAVAMAMAPAQPEPTPATTSTLTDADMRRLVDEFVTPEKVRQLLEEALKRPSQVDKNLRSP